MNAIPSPEFPAYSYLRFSSSQQRLGESARRQSEQFDAYCKAHKLTPATVPLKDTGVSAFRGKNATVGALAKFRQLVEAGKVDKGSTLVVEHLDRLSRNQISDALTMFISLCKAGITVVTLIDGKVYNEETLNNLPDLMYSLMLFAQAHEQSATKSHRISDVWKKRRRDAAEGKATSRRLPSWIILRDRQYMLIPERANLIRWMYEQAKKGWGISLITADLNRRKVPTWGGSRQWGKSFIIKLLRNRQIIGEYQPTKIEFDAAGAKKQKPIGQPIENYFPAVVDEQTFYLVQRGLEQRQKTGGRLGLDTKAENVLNIWNGILEDTEGRPVVQTTTGLRRRSLVRGEYLRGFVGETPVFFPADEFDWAMVFRLYDSAFNQAPDQSKEQAESLTAVQQEMKQVREAIDTIQTKVANLEVKFDFVFSTLEKLENRLTELRKAEEAGKMKVASRSLNYRVMIGDWFRTLDGLKAGNLPNERRLELREVLRAMFTKVVIAWKREGYQNFKCAAVCFGQDGTATRVRFDLIGKREKIVKNGKFAGWTPTTFDVDFPVTPDTAFEKEIVLNQEEKADAAQVLGIDVDKIILARRVG